MKNAFRFVSSFVFIAVVASGCKQRSFNSGKVKSEDSGANSGDGADKVVAKKSFSCPGGVLIAADVFDPATGKIDPRQEPKPQPAGNFKYTLIDNGGEFKIEIQKDYSFSHWASIAAGKPSSEKKADSLTLGKVVKANLGTCQRSHCFRIDYKIWPANDESKQSDLHMEFWTKTDPKGKTTFSEDPTITIDRKDGSQMLGGILGHCVKVDDEGVVGMLNTLVDNRAPTPMDASSGTTSP